MFGELSKLWSLFGPYYNTGPNTGPNLGDPKRDHDFDNSPFGLYNVGNMALGIF